MIDALTELKRLLGRLGPSIGQALDNLTKLLRRGGRGSHLDDPTPRVDASGAPEGWRPLSREDIDSLPIIRDGSHLNPDGTPKPNSWYQTGEHDYVYHTNENGHIDRFYAEDLQLKDHEGRLRHDPDTPGKGPDDHAGHLAADSLGGSPKLDNLVSMLDKVNIKEYAGLERIWRGVLNANPPGTVSVDVRITTDPATGRPTEFIIDHIVNGRPKQVVLNQ